MFGLSFREKLAVMIRDACINNIGVYVEGIKQLLLLAEGNQDVWDKKYPECRHDYFVTVADSVFSSFRTSSSQMYTRIQLARMHPSLCGYEDAVTQGEGMAGTVYAICFYAYYDKPAKPSDCVALNHIQNQIMDEALTQLEQALTSFSQ